LNKYVKKFNINNESTFFTAKRETAQKRIKLQTLNCQQIKSFPSNAFFVKKENSNDSGGT
jgi:hypothetical protein